MPDATNQSKPETFLQRNRTLLMAAILSIYSLPPNFFVVPNMLLDGSWQRALNMAIKNQLIFGTEFVFTYGPLGFLSTRNTQYVSPVFQLLADVFLFAGIFYFIYRYLAPGKAWFFILLPGLFFFRDVNYAQELFLIFIVFASLSFKNNFSFVFETIYCSLSGVLLFFIKINYGIITLTLLPLVAIFLLLKNRRAFGLFVVPAVLLFFFIYFNVHIDLVNYTKNGMLLIRYYDESMYLAVIPGAPYFIYGMLLIGMFTALIVYYLVRLSKKNYGVAKTVPVLLLSFACFLFYKNGYTRFDGEHYGYFLSVFPLFIISSVFLLDCENFLASRLISILPVVFAGAYFMQPRLESKIFDWNDFSRYVSPVHYFAGIFEDNAEHIPEDQLFDEAKQRMLVDSTIDVFPTQIAWMQFNSLNYKPRPVPQSYSVYCGALDSLNASFFLRKGRPQLVLLSNQSIDHRYSFWDESLTKATLHLNYSENEIFNEDWLLRYSFPKMLLLHSKAGSHQYPRFEKISAQTISVGDTVRFNFPDSIPVYMTADFRYNLAGKLSRIFFQPPAISVTLMVENKGNMEFEAVRSIIENPVLINKAVLNNFDLKNFFQNNLKENKNITGFVFNTNSSMFEKKINIIFLEFANY